MLNKNATQRPNIRALRRLRGPNGILERYLSEGNLKIQEHRFSYNCVLKQRELQRREKALKQREAAVREKQSRLEAS